MAVENAERLVWQSRSLDTGTDRNDLHLTSSGVGHAYAAPRDTDVCSVKRTALLPLPPVLEREPEATDQEFLTTNRTVHSYQPMDTVVAHPEHSRAAPCYKAHFNENFTYRLKERSWRHPLDAEHQSSEYQAHFRGEKAKPPVEGEFGTDLRRPTLVHHHKDLPLTRLNPTYPKETPESVRGSAPHEGGVYIDSEEFLTTHQQRHHRYPRDQQLSLPRPNQATVHHCEQVPKAWGHGTQEPVLNPHQVPQHRGREMRDATRFKHATHDIMPSYQLPPVPHSGLTTIVQSSYVGPSPEQMENTFSSPFGRMQHVTAPVKFAMPLAPKMYQTNYNMYGTAPF